MGLKSDIKNAFNRPLYGYKRDLDVDAVDLPRHIEEIKGIINIGDVNDYIDELQDRTERSSAGKDFTSKSIGYFSGFSFPKDEKNVVPPVKEENKEKPLIAGIN